MLSKDTKNRVIGVAILFGVLAFNIKLIDDRMLVSVKNEALNAAAVQSAETASTSAGPTATELLQVGMLAEASPFEETTSKVEESNPSSMPEQSQDIEPPDKEVQHELTESKLYLEMSEDDTYELATLVYLESGTESYECQKAIASVVIHRMQNDNLTLQEVIYAKNQFSPAYLVAESEPSESTLAAVQDVLQNGPSIPNYVTFFRADYYHNWSELIIPYCVIDHTYFSADTRLMN